jgi:hypothetical protein
MPVPPIYQPEIAADGVHWAAHHRRRELYVGASTCWTIWGSQLAPWLAEWYLAKTGVQGQQTEPAVDLPRNGNLFDALPEDPGTHGRFDDRAHPRGVQLLLAKHRGAVAVGLAAAAGALAAVRR